MSFVKVLFGSIVTQDFTLSEGKVGFTESDHLYSEMEAKGIVKLFSTKAEAEAYVYKSSMELFHESYKSLNPPEGEVVLAPTLDFEKCAPVVTDGVPANIIEQPKVEVPVETPTQTPVDIIEQPKVETSIEAPAEAPVEEASAPATERSYVAPTKKK